MPVNTPVNTLSGHTFAYYPTIVAHSRPQKHKNPTQKLLSTWENQGSQHEHNMNLEKAKNSASQTEQKPSSTRKWLPYRGFTSRACGPFWPSPISNSTAWFSSSVLKPVP